MIAFLAGFALAAVFCSGALLGWMRGYVRGRLDRQRELDWATRGERS